MSKNLLSHIHCPKDVKCLSEESLLQLSQEIRVFLIENVSKTGGHLSSNLGVVELSIALHKVFDSPQDVFVFDVGHQCYTHKILTGRKDQFSTLRQKDGLSGFPSPPESPHDVLRAGHASNSISVAIGVARAKKLKGEPGYVVVVIGDGSFTGGLAYEGMNNIGDLNNLIVILNDNTMSISKNVGSLASHFKRLRKSYSYYRTKHDVKNVLESTPVIGGGVHHGFHSVKGFVKKAVYRNNIFEDMGFIYCGPENGHDLLALCRLLENAKEAQKPILLHIETIKGKGFIPAEKNPGAFHGVSAFNVRAACDPDISPKDSFSTIFGKELVKLGAKEPRLCGITAAMKYGTGLQYFKKAYPDRFFDVGMAEGHAISFAVGMAETGMVPVAAIYSTFLQRSYDQLIHDVMLSHAKVIFAIDRAGLVPGDGETHQGIYDVAYLSQQQSLFLVSPSNYEELRYWLKQLVMHQNSPCAIRYPRGGETEMLSHKKSIFSSFDCLIKYNSAKCAMVSYGTEIEEVLKAEQLLKTKNIEVDVYQMMVLSPLPKEIVVALKGYDCIVFAEEGIRRGGLGEHLLADLHQEGFMGEFLHCALPETGIDHASVEQLREMWGLGAQTLCELVLQQGMLV